jgi:hypothetical protein
MEGSEPFVSADSFNEAEVGIGRLKRVFLHK